VPSSHPDHAARPDARDPLTASDPPARQRLRLVADGAALQALSDEELMLRHRDGHPGCFDLLVQRHGRRTQQFLIRMGFPPSRAEEIAADVFLKVHRAAPRYEASAKFTTFLYTVARRAGMNARNRASSRLEVAAGGLEMDEGPAPPVDLDAALGARRSVALLQAELNRLPPEHQDAFALYYGQGLSCTEVAQTLQITPAEAKGRLAYARKLLRQRLAGRVPEATSPENES
jgi:RNA polymerase sigma-70 factor (ECF subfamily)